jgi:hypothetical protein
MGRINLTTIIFVTVIVCVGLAHLAFAGDKSLETNKKILVNIERQKLIAVESSKLVFEYDVVTGRPNKETHPGTFAISRKYKDYTSKTYGSERPSPLFVLHLAPILKATNKSKAMDERRKDVISSITKIQAAHTTNRFTFHTLMQKTAKKPENAVSTPAVTS